ncbi:MAG TPA: hypothetical protein ENJ95_20435, partial [Bacteroidetes bacterium]|nr:hypothetical protein [Bacteroidota bacterium]
MKILIAGHNNAWALERHYAKHMSKHADIVLYPAEDVFDEFYHVSVLNKIKFKLNLSSIYKKISDQLLAKISVEKPDVVWIIKGMRILPKTILAIKQQGVKTVNYNTDHPFYFSGKGSGNKNITDSIGLYDLHLCYHQEVKNRIEKEYGLPTADLPFGFELDQELFEEINKQAKTNRVCFIGNPDKIRAGYINFLTENGLEVDVYGRDWKKALPRNTSANIRGAIYGKEFWEKMNAYRVQLNIFKPHNDHSHNMRTFEIPAA